MLRLGFGASGVDGKLGFSKDVGARVWSKAFRLQGVGSFVRR